jgi:copper chaperone CopZ
MQDVEHRRNASKLLTTYYAWMKFFLRFAFWFMKGASMRKIFIITVLMLCAAVAVQAAVVGYTIPVPGVVWGSTAARARGAVEPIEGVSEVKTNITSHTLTVRFEDTVTGLDAITEALNIVGYTVGEVEELD